MTAHNKFMFFVLLLNCISFAEPADLSRDYSIQNAIIGSLVGVGVGGVFGGFAAGPSIRECREGINEDYEGLCSLGIIYGMGIGAGVGYTLAIPIGGHLKGGFRHSTFLVNISRWQ